MTDDGPVRLDTALVRRGLARSRRRAAELVTAGQVRVGGAVARKPSQPVAGADHVQLCVADRPEYVSRGADKLLGALAALDRLAPGAVTVAGARCLDAGASTGGFTQVLLERGAAHVVAVDVGHGQIADPVARDARVSVREGTNVRALTAAAVGGPVDLVVADLSFISLTLVVPVLLALTRPGGHLLVMVKPQFEVGRKRLAGSGVVTSPQLRQDAVVGVARTACRAGASVRAVVPSPLPGPSGNHEYFLWLRPGPQQADGAVPAASGDEVVRAAAVAVREGRAVLVGSAGRAPWDGSSA